MEKVNEKYAFNEVFELSIFDQKGAFVTNLDWLKQTNFLPAENKIYVKDSIMNIDLLKFFGEVSEDDQSDFEKALYQTKNRSVITFGKKNYYKECKVIANGKLMNVQNCLVQDFIIEIPSATISFYDALMSSANRDSNQFNLEIHLNEYNDIGHRYRMHIENSR